MPETRRGKHVRRNLDERTAMKGYDDRPVFTDPITQNLYAALTPAMRSQVRRMMRTDWQGRTEIAPADLANGDGVASASISVSDCVARSEVVFATAGLGKVVTSARSVAIGATLPQTVMNSMRGRPLTDVIDHPVLEGLEVQDVDATAEGCVLYHSYDSRYLVDVI